MEEKLNKKLLLVLVKYGTWLIGVAYFIQIILNCFGLYSFVLTYLFSVSIVPIITLIGFSIFLGFCIWHRMPLYYAITLDIINIIDYYIGIPVSNMWMLIICLLLIGLFILIGSYIKNRKNVSKRNIKEKFD